MNDPRKTLSTADVAAKSPNNPTVDRDAQYRPPSDPPNETRVDLLPQHERDDLKTRWGNIQAEFVDEPRRSVEEADALVAATIQRVAEVFAEARSTLESNWARGGDVSTEDLRVALRQYRSFFDRMLTV